MSKPIKHTNKILLVLFNDSLGGAEQYLKMVAEHYLERSYEVVVFFLTKKEAGGWVDLEKYEKFQGIYGASHNRLTGVYALVKYCRKLKKSPPKLTFTSHVHLNGTIGFFRSVGIHKSKFHVARESTSIFTRYGGLKLWLFKMQYRLGYRRIDLLICQSAYMRNQLLKNLPKLESKMKVVVFNNPVNLSKIENSSKEEIDEAKLDSQYIVSAGRLIPEKGFDVLINAFSELKIDIPGLKLLILGEGQLRTPLEAQISSLQLNEDVLMPGFVKNVYPYFKEASVCVVSSRIEGFPNVLLQMMSQNTKVVSTLCAGGIELIKGIHTLKPDDAVELEKSIRQALADRTEGIDQLFKQELQSRNISSFVAKVEEAVEK